MKNRRAQLDFHTWKKQVHRHIDSSDEDDDENGIPATDENGIPATQPPPNAAEAAEEAAETVTSATKSGTTGQKRKKPPETGTTST